MKTLTAMRTRLQNPKARRAIATANARREAAESARLEREMHRDIRMNRIYRGEIEDTTIEDCRPSLGWGGSWGF